MFRWRSWEGFIRSIHAYHTNRDELWPGFHISDEMRRLRGFLLAKLYSGLEESSPTKDADKFLNVSRETASYAESDLIIQTALLSQREN